MPPGKSHSLLTLRPHASPRRLQRTRKTQAPSAHTAGHSVPALLCAPGQPGPGLPNAPTQTSCAASSLTGGQGRVMPALRQGGTQSHPPLCPDGSRLPPGASQPGHRCPHPRHPNPSLPFSPLCTTSAGVPPGPPAAQAANDPHEAQLCLPGQQPWSPRPREVVLLSCGQTPGSTPGSSTSLTPPCGRHTSSAPPVPLCTQQASAWPCLTSPFQRPTSAQGTRALEVGRPRRRPHP